MTYDDIIDLQDLSDNNEFIKQFVIGFRSHTETVYIGMGEADDDFEMSPTVISQLQETQVELTAEDNYIYFLYPNTCAPEISMSGIGIPMTTLQNTITLDGKTYAITKSRNTYRGILTIGLLLKF